MEFFKQNKGQQDKIVKFKLRAWSVLYMDEQAQEENFDDLTDLRIPDDDSPEEEALAQAGNAFRKAVRVITKQIRKDVGDDVRAMPTEAEFRAELPTLILPE
jgi:hypothetical protein